MWTNRNGREHMYWNNVETQPGAGYPRGYEDMGGGFDANGNLAGGREPSLEDYGVPWEYNYEESLMTGTDPWMRPNVKPTWGPNWDEDEGEGEYPNSYYFYLPRICNHCTNPACLAACSRNAIYKRQEDGIVLIDQERCRGYRYCACRRARFRGTNYSRRCRRRAPRGSGSAPSPRAAHRPSRGGRAGGA